MMSGISVHMPIKQCPIHTMSDNHWQQQPDKDGYMENTEPEFRSRSSGAGVSESEPRSVTSKNGKHVVQNMENTESDVKYGKHGVRSKKYEKDGV